MGSYITGTVIAMSVVFGLYATHETSTGNPIFGQDRLGALSEDDLRAMAKDLRSPDQIEAILQLGDRPGDLEKTVPLLAQMATTRFQTIKNAAESSLAQIGADGAEHLRGFLDEDTTRGYCVSCSAMRAIGPGSKIFMPEIKRLLVSDNPLHRKCGLYALQGMGEDGKAAMKEIIVCVLDEDLNNQCSACRVLETFGRDAIEAQESLLELQKTGGPSTRGWAAVCLGAIGPTSSNVDIAEILADQLSPGLGKRPVSPIEQQRVLLGLANLGPEATKVADVIRNKMKVKNKFISGHAAYALWRVTGNSDESLPVLRSLLNDPLHMDHGIFLIGKMGPQGNGLVQEVAHGLRSSEPDTRELAVEAIANMGTAAESFKGSIRERLDDNDASVRIAARRALLLMK